MNEVKFSTHIVKIGELEIGGKNPVLVQSMTSTPTLDTEKTVEQILRLIEAGCPLVRLTAPNIKEAEQLKNIKNELKKRHQDIPLVADIHFTPNAAEIAALYVEKVRINPGNYADKKKFETLIYTDQTYQEELLRIEEKFLPLLNLCKKNQVALRIGVNHGSLSDRILSRYGDTVEGMVESAMEFLRICQKNNFDQVVISMKASNVLVMVQAYRHLVKILAQEKMSFPLHLGVTEAGDGEDGRIKSALGIGTLLAEGIGDTIRVSLTEDPEKEIPVAKKMVERYENWQKNSQEKNKNQLENFINKNQNYQLQKTEISTYFNLRQTYQNRNIGSEKVPIVWMDRSNIALTPATFFPFDLRYAVKEDKWILGDQATDYIYIGQQKVDFEIPGSLGLVQDAEIWNQNLDQNKIYKEGFFPIFSTENFLSDLKKHQTLNFLHFLGLEATENIFLMEKIAQDESLVLVFSAKKIHKLQEQRAFFDQLEKHNILAPVIFWETYPIANEEDLMLEAAVDLGALFLEGKGNGIGISAPKIAPKTVNSIAFSVLQAARQRICKTEYIACPSCGRTEFDLQETTQKIRAKTQHLKGLKIGIMGCIVNGPGEMADADYGYVGTGKGLITLYKKQEIVQKNIPEVQAVEALIALIKQHNDWQDPRN